ncbi:MAG: hypothetical protein C0424_12735 [Sphingobacteriaceae bacterium]|nr:hypothetical protein [Sphingobacteriaceae bacterium]
MAYLHSKDPLIEIAHSLDMGMLCYVHKNKGEVVILATDDEAMLDDEGLADLDLVENNPNSYIRLERPDSKAAFRFMQKFIETFENDDRKQALYDLLRGPRPFHHFSHAMKKSKKGAAWEVFRVNAIRDHVEKELEDADVTLPLKPLE